MRFKHGAKNPLHIPRRGLKNSLLFKKGTVNFIIIYFFEFSGMRLIPQSSQKEVLNSLQPKSFFRDRIKD